ncbi:MAG: hypothetical protein KKF26_02700, partial [Chloroflexi bacterium]|nr:hypothetical protein [Chloroflexota bacterium]
LRVYEGQLQSLDRVATIEIRQERSVKKQIPDKLLDIDNYLANVVENQDLDATTVISTANKLFRWYDWFKVIFLVLTYSSKVLKRVFKNTHINYVIQFTTRFNLVLREYGLGTLRWTPSLGQDRGYIKIGSRCPQGIRC